MKGKVTAAALLVWLLWSPVSAEREQVDPTLVTVASKFTAETVYRLLVFWVCSPEHCWDEPYLQWLKRGEKLEIEATCPIKEIKRGYRVESAGWEEQEEPPVLRVKARSSYDSSPIEAKITPLQPCEYEFE